MEVKVICPPNKKRMGAGREFPKSPGPFGQLFPAVDDYGTITLKHMVPMAK